MAATDVRQNYHVDCEEAINNQINTELTASYIYLAMANHFGRDDVSLLGMKKFFKESSDEERGHAEILMQFQNKRGGRVHLQTINTPSSNEWGSALDALLEAMALEKKVNESLLSLHKTANDKGDAHLSDFLEGKFLEEQVNSIKKLGDLITQLKRAGTQGLGEYLFDKHLQ